MAKWSQIVFVGEDNHTYYEKAWLLEENDEIVDLSNGDAQPIIGEDGVGLTVGQLMDSETFKGTVLFHGKPGFFGLLPERIVSITTLSQD